MQNLNITYFFPDRMNSTHILIEVVCQVIDDYFNLKCRAQMHLFSLTALP